MPNESHLDGFLLLPGPPPAQPGRVHVSLIDATMADAAATVLAETALTQIAPPSGRLPFRLTLPQQRRPGRRWLFDAKFTADPSGVLAEGDYVLARAVEWPPDGGDQPITLELVRVS
jgi:uncharacterized lipoprotein YbaY